MTRKLFALGLAAFVSAPAFATVAPPVPRLAEWKVPVPAEEPKPGEMEEPAKILERLTQNTKAIGDRLKDADTGEETRKKQEQALKDIDALLKQNEPPPMGGGGGGGSSEMPPPSGGMPPPSGGASSGMKPMGGMGKGQPMGGGSQRPKRSGMGMGDPMMQPGGGKDPMPMPTGGMKDPMMKPAGPGGMEPMRMNPGDKPGTGSNGGQPMKGTPPTLPNEDPFTKQVWGHLPEKLRQQASQYYREQYMPKYQEMLKQYYSNLAERDKPAKK